MQISCGPFLKDFFTFCRVSSPFNETFVFRNQHSNGSEGFWPRSQFQRVNVLSIVQNYIDATSLLFLTVEFRYFELSREKNTKIKRGTIVQNKDGKNKNKLTLRALKSFSSFCIVTSSLLNLTHARTWPMFFATEFLNRGVVRAVFSIGKQRRDHIYFASRELHKILLVIYALIF